MYTILLYGTYKLVKRILDRVCLSFGRRSCARGHRSCSTFIAQATLDESVFVADYAAKRDELGSVVIPQQGALRTVTLRTRQVSVAAATFARGGKRHFLYGGG